MTDEVRVQHKFTRLTDDGVSYTDSLYFSLEEYALLDSKALDALEDERFVAYTDGLVKAAEVDSLRQELEAKLAELDHDEIKAVLAVAVAEADAKVDAKEDPKDEQPIDEVIEVDPILEP